MPKLVTGMRISRGFTLIEILVVVLIVGITMGFALLAFGDFGANRRIIVATEQFVSYTKLVQQQAILETGTLGIRFDRNRYQVLRYNTSSSGWMAMSPSRIFRSQAFPANTVVIVASTVGRRHGTPQIIIGSTGDMTPFKLHIGTSKQADLAIVVGELNGKVAMQFIKSP